MESVTRGLEQQKILLKILLQITKPLQASKLKATEVFWEFFEEI